MEATPEQRLKDWLSAGALLLETSTPQNTKELDQLLRNRLGEFYEKTNNAKGKSTLQTLAAPEDVQIQTAKEACWVVQQVQEILDPVGSHDVADLDEHPNRVNGTPKSPKEPPPIGTRDLARLRTLVSLIVKWGLELLTRRVVPTWNTRTTPVPSSRPRAEIIDLTSQTQDRDLYLTLVNNMFSLIFPHGVDGPVAQSYLTSSIIQRHSTDILTPAVVLGWLPDSLSSPSVPVQKHLRPLVLRWLKLQSSTQAITSLAHVLSNSQGLPPYVRKVCGTLLTTQLLRNDGVLGLFESVFTEGDLATEETKPDKLEYVARILLAVPVNKDPKDYFSIITPRVARFLSEKARPAYRRAAAFTLSRSITPTKPSAVQKIASEISLKQFHEPLQNMYTEDQIVDISPNTLEVRSTVDFLASLVANSEPLPEFISSLLSPILPDVYMLSFDLDQIKTADPQLKDVVHSILLSWGKIVEPKEGCRVLWSIVKSESKRGEWRYNLDGQLWRCTTQTERQGLSFLTPGDVKQMNAAALDMDMNIFELYPDPRHFVKFLKDLEREDIASDLFVLLLDDYRNMKTHSDQEPMKILHELQLIVQMQAQLGEGTRSNILRKPDQLLAFVAHVLQSSRAVNTEKRTVESLNEGGPSEEDDLSDSDDADSDDEAPDSEVLGPDDELLETTLTLLLSILEAHETLPAHTYPTLNNIFTTLEKLSTHGTSTLMSLAREARLVITAKLANEKHKLSKDDHDEGETSVLETYQKSLKLLQDPILPVRAHGLLLLRQLVTTSFLKKTSTSASTPPNQKKYLEELVQTLGPSILSIFLQSVQDNDSYIFLNAVQGLSAMVDSFGKEILRALLQQYTNQLTGLGVGNLSQQDVDNRTRIGEALSNVIKRCGSALGIYVDFIVPPLFAIVRSRDVPVAIRQSSISLLGDCVDTYPLAMLPYIDDLAQGLLDLLKLEGVVSAPAELNKCSKDTPNIEGEINKDDQGKKRKVYVESEDEDEGSKPKSKEKTPLKPSLDTDPTSKDSKIPSLRRSALHFFTLLIRSAIKEVYDGRSNYAVPIQLPQRAKNVLGYLNATDEDPVVRLMAGEAAETLDELQEALLGV